MVVEEGFAAPALCKTEALLGSVARGAIVEGVNDMEGGCEAEVVTEERVPEGVAVRDWVIDAE
jgi:hypothetical protein